MAIDEEQKKMKHYVKLSAGLHAALFLSFVIGSFFAPTPTQMLPSVQIDMVALPTQVKNKEAPLVDVSLPVKENTPEPEPRPEPSGPRPPPPAEPKDDLARERKKELDARKRAAEALRDMREQRKNERRAEEARKREALEKRKADLQAFERRYREAISGNQRNEGTALSGQMEATQNAYLGHITDKIRSQWALPAFLQTQSLSARMVIRLDARGNVIKMEFSKVSGNNLFDEYVERAIRRSSPFFPPPAEMAGALRNPGIEVKFPL